MNESAPLSGLSESEVPTGQTALSCSLAVAIKTKTCIFGKCGKTGRPACSAVQATIASHPDVVTSKRFEARLQPIRGRAPGTEIVGCVLCLPSFLASHRYLPRVHVCTSVVPFPFNDTSHPRSRHHLPRTSLDRDGTRIPQATPPWRSSPRLSSRCRARPRGEHAGFRGPVVW